MSAAPGDKPAFTPLARMLFGWTRARGAAGSALAGVGALGAILVVAEFMRPRLGLRMPMESQPGFYALLGVGVVAATLLAALALAVIVQREAPYKRDASAQGAGEGGGNDRA
jgi:hypothetical protein